MSAIYPAPCGLCGAMLADPVATRDHFVAHAIEGHPALERAR